MVSELRVDAIVDSFKKDIYSVGFINKTECENIIKQLDILADSNGKRFKAIESAKWLWKTLVWMALNDITDNIRGYYDICKYFDEYVEYENLLFALDENHRDHVIHSMWVMLIGFYLKKNLRIFSNLVRSEMAFRLGEDEESKKFESEMANKLSKYEQSLWCLIALTHDLGYPIEKTAKANLIMSKMIRHFGFITQSEFKYNFTAIHQTAIESLLKTISSRVVWISREGHTLWSYSGTRLDYAKSLERLDHGIMSAYLLQMYLDFICEEVGVVEGCSPELGDPRKESAVSKAIIISLLRSIAAHTDCNVYWRDINFIDPFLLICDELDEFSRYSHSVTKDEWIRIGCRTEFELSDKCLDIKYTFDNKEIGDDIEQFFKLKVKNLHNRLEISSENMKSITIKCVDIRKAPPIEYSYERNIKDLKNGIIRKIPANDTLYDVQAFLDGEIRFST